MRGEVGRNVVQRDLCGVFETPVGMSGAPAAHHRGLHWREESGVLSNSPNVKTMKCVRSSKEQLVELWWENKTE